jgi:hypothetical protein
VEGADPFRARGINWCGGEKTRTTGLWYRPVFTHEDGSPMGSIFVWFLVKLSEKHIIQKGLKSREPRITPLNREIFFFYNK